MMKILLAFSFVLILLASVSCTKGSLLEKAQRQLSASSCVACLNSGTSHWCTESWSRSSGTCCLTGNTVGSCDPNSYSCSNSADAEANSQWLFCPEHYDACGEQQLYFSSSSDKITIKTKSDFSNNTVCWYKFYADSYYGSEVHVKAEHLEDAYVEIYYAEREGNYSFVNNIEEGDVGGVQIESANSYYSHYVWILVEATSNDDPEATLYVYYDSYELSAGAIAGIVIGSICCCALIIGGTIGGICLCKHCHQKSINKNTNNAAAAKYYEPNQNQAQQNYPDPGQNMGAPQPQYYSQNVGYGYQGEPPEAVVIPQQPMGYEMQPQGGYPQNQYGYNPNMSLPVGVPIHANQQPVNNPPEQKQNKA